VKVSTRGDYASRALLSLALHGDEAGPTSVRDIAERTGLPQPYLEQILLALKGAGLDVAGVNAAQMGVVLRRVLPSELATRGIEDAAAVCEAIAEALAAVRFEVGQDRASQAAATVARFGS